MHKNNLTFVTLVALICSVSISAAQRTFDKSERTVPVVRTVGCVEMESGSWFLTRATAPEEAEFPFASFVEVEDARVVSLGFNRFELVGVTDFLDAESLLSLHQRSEFTTLESENSTGQLSEGHRVAVKGLYITSVEPHRLNLTSVFSVSDTCR